MNDESQNTANDNTQWVAHLDNIFRYVKLFFNQLAHSTSPLNLAYKWITPVKMRNKMLLELDSVFLRQIYWLSTNNTFFQQYSYMQILYNIFHYLKDSHSDF